MAEGHARNGTEVWCPVQRFVSHEYSHHIEFTPAFSPFVVIHIITASNCHFNAPIAILKPAHYQLARGKKLDYHKPSSIPIFIQFPAPFLHDVCVRTCCGQHDAKNSISNAGCPSRANFGWMHHSCTIFAHAPVADSTMQKIRLGIQIALPEPILIERTILARTI